MPEKVKLWPSASPLKLLASHTFFSSSKKKVCKEMPPLRGAYLDWRHAEFGVVGAQRASSKPWEPLSTGDRGIKKSCAKRCKSQKRPRVEEIASLWILYSKRQGSLPTLSFSESNILLPPYPLSSDRGAISLLEAAKDARSTMSGFTTRTHFLSR